MDELGLDADEVARRMGRWTLVAGIVQIVLGLFAVVLAGATTVVTVVILGAILAVTGLLDVVDFAGTARARRSWWKLARGVLFAVAGVAAIVRPGTAAVAIALVVAVSFLAAGAFGIAAAVTRRPPRWGWIAAGGALSALLGVLILAQWPSSSVWVVGVLVGIEVMFHGWTMVMVWLGFREFASEIEAVAQA